MFIQILILIFGLALLGIGAEALVSGSSRLALRLGIAPIFIGLTIFSFGTSAPELAVSMEAALNGSSAIALSNIVGSNIANIGLILGITVMLAPTRIVTQLIRMQMPILIVVSISLWLLLIDGEIGLTDGILLSLGLIVFVVVSYRAADPQQASTEIVLPEVSKNPALSKLPVNIAFIIGGLALLIVGSQLFVESAITLAQLFGVSEVFIGLTIVAVGTSLPEFATSVLAALRKQPDIAVGNIVGSNVFNILGILGVTAIVTPISALDISVVDLAAMLLFAIALLPLARSGYILSRIKGFILLATYVAYIAYLGAGL